MRVLLVATAAALLAATPAGAQIFPGTRLCTDPIPHTAVFTRTISLTAGTTNHFFTTGTTGWFLQGASPDTVMELVAPSSGAIVAFNDDFIGLDSDFIFQPSKTGVFRLIVHSFSTASAGFTNVMLSVNGAAPTALAASTKFGGTHVLTDWNSGIRFDTAGGNGDTVLILRSGRGVGATLLFNDDLGSNRTFSAAFQGALNSTITPAFSGHGGLVDNSDTDAIVGSFSQNTEGETALCQIFRSWMSPLLSPPRDAPKPSPIPATPQMKQYLSEYEALKPKLIEMSPDERAAVLEKMKAATIGRAMLQVEPDYGVTIDGGVAERQ